MTDISKIKNIDEFNQFFHQKTLHPMVSVGDLSYADHSLFRPTDLDMYCIVLMDDDYGQLIRDGQVIHYEAGSIFSLKPGQVISLNLKDKLNPKGWILAFRPEFLIKTGLGRDFYMFSYFNYEGLEALALSSEERRILLDCLNNIIRELHEPANNITGHMLRLCMGLLLSYCKRFYERKYDSLVADNSELRQKLDSLLDDYQSSGLPIQNGQPTVAWCAQQFHWSPNYFGDVVKRHLHISAQEYIQGKIIDAAKALLSDPNLSITEIADTLGFMYPNHFTRLFHRKEGVSPSQYRLQKKNNLKD